MASEVGVGASFSSYYLSSITKIRNKHPGIPDNLITEALYVSAIPCSIAETALATIAALGSVILIPETTTPFDKSVTWLKSSGFSIAWSLHACMLNFVDGELPVEEGKVWDVLEELKLDEACHAGVD